VRRIGAIIIAAAVLAAVVTSIVAISRLRRQQAEEAAARAHTQQGHVGASQAKSPTHGEAKGIEIVEKDAEGNMLWRLKAAGAVEYDQLSRVVKARDVRWEYEYRGQPAIVIEAPEFAGNYGQRRLEFTQGVLIRTVDNQQTFNAQKVVYEFDSGKLLMHSPRLTKGRYRFSGATGQIDVAARKVRLGGGVRAVRN